MIKQEIKSYLPCSEETVHSMKAYCRGDFNMDFIQRHLFISVPLNLHPERPVPKPDKTGREETTSAYIVSDRGGQLIAAFTQKPHVYKKMWTVFHDCSKNVLLVLKNPAPVSCVSTLVFRATHNVCRLNDKCNRYKEHCHKGRPRHRYRYYRYWFYTIA